MGITITDVKIVGFCSKHRKEGDEILRDLDGREYRDDELSCVGCALGDGIETELEFLKRLQRVLKHSEIGSTLLDNRIKSISNINQGSKNV